MAVAEAVEIGPSQRFAIAQTKTLRNGAGGAGMVAGDHLYRDTCAVAVGDGGNGFLARWIEHTDQTEQHVIAVQVLIVETLLRFAERPKTFCDHRLQLRFTSRRRTSPVA